MTATNKAALNAASVENKKKLYSRAGPDRTVAKPIKTQTNSGGNEPNGKFNKKKNLFQH